MNNLEYIIEILSKLDIGIEFGGPTHLLTKDILVYPYLQNLDGANLFENNMWFGDKFKNEQKYNYYQNKSGDVFNIDVADELQLQKLDKKYDYIISCHNIEHLANPLNSIILWKNILKENGYIFSIIPDKFYIFDHKRDLTTFEHLLFDYENNTDEYDKTHIQDNLDKIDIIKKEDFYKYHDNFNFRVCHHHCFDINLVEKMYIYCGYKIVSNFKFDSQNILSLVQKI